MSLPRATMRLQFHRGFTFADARSLAPYFASLGISHIYASPIMTARPGSPHGYDVVDPTRVNPELGGEAELLRLVEELRRHDLGLIVDIVPNHMAVGDGNRCRALASPTSNSASSPADSSGLVPTTSATS